MPRITIKHLDSLEALREAAPTWDALWQRSETHLPTARAELLALWCESFAPDQPFRAWLVEQDGRLVAALPLLETNWLAQRIGSLPGNHWSSAGDFLLDPLSDVETVCDSLVAALHEQAWPLLRFEGLAADADHWQSFCDAVERQRLTFVRRHRFAIDLVRIEGEWEEYFASRSRNHRRHIRKSRQRAEREGKIALTLFDDLAPDAVEPLLRACFEIENGGWKGATRSAVLSVPGVWEFYLAQARQLAAWGQLRIILFWHSGRPIAYEYGWLSKGAYFSLKVGYDEAFRHLAPGQLLRAQLIERFFSEKLVEVVDFFGPASDATSKWATDQYCVDRLVIANRGLLGRCLVMAYRHVWPLVHRIVGTTGARAKSARAPQNPGVPDSQEAVAAFPADA